MIKLLSGFGLLVLMGCVLDYEDNKRLLVKGKIVDEQGEPVAGIDVKVLGHNEVMGQVLSANDGSFQVITLSPKTQKNMGVSINYDYDISLNNNYASYLIDGLERLGEEKATFDLEELTLERLINASLEVHRITNTIDTLFFSYDVSPSLKRVNFGVVQEIENEFDFIAFDTLPPAQASKKLQMVRVPAKSPLRFRYKLTSAASSAPATQEIMFNADTKTYVFEF